MGEYEDFKEHSLLHPKLLLFEQGRTGSAVVPGLTSRRIAIARSEGENGSGGDDGSADGGHGGAADGHVSPGGLNRIGRPALGRLIGRGQEVAGSLVVVADWV